ncbi:alpha-tocopherol transfer protein-like [Stegodyphus dumicola]|uniref:alpha-tocopherol transfer protein-like n=1 Tax=Stegodyphus dumicola TaxID=202533 RepID=UPI0015A94213|nr:alpha-tocopherol transfer protein-like [Stegodyphus dumicola]XP_035221025.1 alpha-tocopherol transfer protein-like [Stegodyphus dumicola]
MDCTPLLMEGLTPEMEKIAERELCETSLVKKESLENIKELIENEPNFHPFMDDQFLLMFLRCKKHDIQKAFDALRNFYIFKEKHSRIISNFLPSEFKTIMDMKCFTILLSRDCNGSAVVIVRVGQFNWKEATIEDLTATVFTIAHIINRLEATSVCGCVIVFDLKDFTLQMLFKYVTPKYLIFIIRCLQNCFPLRIKGMHLINEPYFFQIFFEIVKVALPKKLRERIFLHGRKLEGLHKFIPAEILPNELGGKAGPFDSTEMFNYVLRHESLLQEMNKCGFKP